MDLYAEGPDDGHITKKVELGASVRAVECKYKCGGYIIVTTMARKPPHHFECALKAGIECQKQMAARSGPYYEKWQKAMANSADRWVQGCKLARDRYANSATK